MRLLLSTLALTSVFSTSALAYDGISTVSTATTTGTPSQAEGLTFNNNVVSLVDFSTTSGATYTVGATAPNAFAQRNGTPNQSSVWYASSGTSFSGVHQTDYGTLLKTNNFLSGSDNTFNNGTGASSGNIERIDFTWGSPFSTNLNSLAFAVFDRGGATVHDAFGIAIVTGVNPTTGLPTSYGGFIRVAAGWGAATNPISDQGYNLFRYGTGNDISASNSHDGTGTQGVGGVVIKVSDFNLPAGTSVYGYSLLGTDVNPVAFNDLLDVTNTAVFPADTSDTMGGGIDLAAVNGLELRLVVPEPSTWALLLGFGGTFLLWTVRSGRGKAAV